MLDVHNATGAGPAAGRLFVAVQLGVDAAWRISFPRRVRVSYRTPVGSDVARRELRTGLCTQNRRKPLGVLEMVNIAFIVFRI